MAILVRDFVKWANASELGGRWAVLLFLSTPLTYTEGSSLFIESIWSCFILAGALALCRSISLQKESLVFLPVSGYLLGIALASKAVTFTVLPVLFALLVVGYKRLFRAGFVKYLVIGLVAFLLLGSIPYATAWLKTGNPIFPFFNQIFHSPYWPSVAFEAPAIFGKGVTWDILYRVTFYSGNFIEGRPGAAGFQWLLLFLPSLVALLFRYSHRQFALYFFVIFSVVLSFHFTAYLRYVFPAFAWGAAVIGIAISKEDIHEKYLQRVFVFTGWLVVFLNLVFFTSGTYYGKLNLLPVLSESGRNAFQAVNALNTSLSPVAMFSPSLAGDLHSDALYPNWYNFEFQSKVGEFKTEKMVADTLLDYRVDYVIIDNNWGSKAKRNLIKTTLDEIVSFGDVSVLKLKDSYRYQSELIKSSNFENLDNWSFSGVAKKSRNALRVNVKFPAIQSVIVKPGVRYKNEIVESCAEMNTEGRIQVNWLDKEGRFIDTKISVFPCSGNPTVHAQFAVAPPNAYRAIIYATGHTNKDILIYRVSFRK